MFSLKVILISSLGLIIICLIRPSSEISIKKLTEKAKVFFKKVKNLDSQLNLPPYFEKFANINYYGNWLRKIRSNEESIEKFITEFEKLTTYTREVVINYFIQIEIIVKNGELGKLKKRIKLCKFYNINILPLYDIKGYGGENETVKKLRDNFKYELGRLYNKILYLIPPELRYKAETIRAFRVGSVLIPLEFH